MITKRKFLALSVAAVLSLGMSGMASAADDELKIGLLLPTSGPLSFVGGTMKQAADLMVEEYKAKGGIGGKPFSVQFYDTESNTTLVGQQMRRLIETDGVDVVLGPTVTGETLTARPIANELKVPLLPFAGTEAVTEPATPYLFSVVPSDRQVAKAMIDLAKKQGLKKIAFLYSADGFGQTGLNVLKQLLDSEGVELVATEEFGPRDADMTPQIMRIRSADPDVMFVWGVNPGPTIIMKNAKQIGFNKPIYNSYGVAVPQFIEQTGATGEGSYVAGTAIMAAKSLPEDDEIRKANIANVEAFEAKYGKPVAAMNGYVFDAFKALDAAITENGGKTDRESIAAALRKIGFTGANGKLQFKEGSSTAQSPDSGAMVMLKIENGKFVLAE
ncbi:ABC transporter substrate-binding protein [Daeguia caeni]|uniref:ABC transporter substrate-binding protein n=1 Tax=Daeguia caeni TaxID=439612 RepID=A0ABV9HA10_9HYPH